MDVQRNTTRERVFSILNDNDSPSFVIRSKQQGQPKTSQQLPSTSTLSPRLERPHFLRQAHYQRNSSVSSVGTPPLLRFDSSSSKSSNSSMDSTPSPITPAYTYNDTASIPYENLLRQDMAAGYLPSPSTITPFMESQMMLTPGQAVQLPGYEPKAMSSMPPTYPTMPMQAQEARQISTPALTNHPSMSSTSSVTTKPSPSNQSQASSQQQQQTLQQQNGLKKNKYPCPYASSHSCVATFTTSGHAARHGKKHTGEKGVHCPVCNKAFTRKDNMKQHERTHKSQKKGADETRSKAAQTKDAQKIKHTKSASITSNHARRTSMATSPVSEAASLAPVTIDTPLNPPEPVFYQDPSPSLMIVPDPALIADVMNPHVLYPTMSDDALMAANALPMASDGTIPKPPGLIRGFSDLDTLAQVAESFDPYYQGQY